MNPKIRKEYNMKDDKKPNNWQKRECGAFWAKESKTANSNKFWSGYVELDKIGINKKVNIVLFKNVSKDGNGNEPVLRAYIGKEHMVQEIELVANEVQDNFDNDIL